MARRRASGRFEEEVPNLLEESGVSLRALARSAGIGPDHLSRVLRHDRGKKVTPELAQRVSNALGLPDDYFQEVRLALIIDSLQQDPHLLDRVYRLVRRSRI